MKGHLQDGGSLLAALLALPVVGVLSAGARAKRVAAEVWLWKHPQSLWAYECVKGHRGRLAKCIP
jgi:hypothetical protein